MYSRPSASTATFCRPPVRPSAEYGLGDMDVRGLRSPSHLRGNRALCCVACSTKRKRAPLSGPPSSRGHLWGALLALFVLAAPSAATSSSTTSPWRQLDLTHAEAGHIGRPFTAPAVVASFTAWASRSKKTRRAMRRKGARGHHRLATRWCTQRAQQRVPCTWSDYHAVLDAMNAPFAKEFDHKNTQAAVMVEDLRRHGSVMQDCARLDSLPSAADFFRLVEANKRKDGWCGGVRCPGPLTKTPAEPQRTPNATCCASTSPRGRRLTRQK